MTTMLATRATPTDVPRAQRRPATVLTIVVTAAAAVASVGGLAIHDLYAGNSPWAAEAGRGGDLVTLAVVVPGLVAALALARRGSVRARLVWGGLLAYGVYNYAFYVFGATFNDLFLVHVIAFSGSILALIAWATELDVHATAARFGLRTPRRTVAALLLATAAIFGTLWTTFSIVYAVTGRLSLGAPSLEEMHLVFALDLSLMVPSMAVGGVLLWRRVPWGYALAVVLGVFGAAYQANLAAAGVFQHQAGIAGAKLVDPIGVATLVAFAVATVALLRRVE